MSAMRKLFVDAAVDPSAVAGRAAELGVPVAVLHMALSLAMNAARRWVLSGQKPSSICDLPTLLHEAEAVVDLRSARPATDVRTVAECAAELGVPVAVLHGLIRRGRLKARKGKQRARMFERGGPAVVFYVSLAAAREAVSRCRKAAALSRPTALARGPLAGVKALRPIMPAHATGSA